MLHKKNYQFIFYSILIILSSLMSGYAQSAAQDSRRLLFIDTALGYLGTPYCYSGDSAECMDCSGFVYRCALQALDVKLPRKASEIAAFAKKVSDEDIQPGDLLFFQESSAISHTGIYIGAGLFIHAASDGPRTGVIVSRIQDSYWKKTYRFAGRLTEPESVFITEPKDMYLIERTEENAPLYPDIADVVYKK